jgi:hypothetical protein
VEEVAALLEAPPGTIAARLSRGRAMLRDRLAMLGLVLLVTDLDDLLYQAFIGPETVPAALAQASYSAPLVSYTPKAPAPAVGCSAATPFICGSIKTKATTIAASLFFGTFACAATVTSVQYLFPPPQEHYTPPVLHDSFVFDDVYPRSSPSNSSVPEPSSLLLLIPGATMMLRRRRRAI